MRPSPVKGSFISPRNGTFVKHGAVKELLPGTVCRGSGEEAVQMAG